MIYVRLRTNVLFILDGHVFLRMVMVMITVMLSSRC